MLPRAAIATNDGDGVSPLPAYKRLCAKAPTEGVGVVGLGGEGRDSTRPAFAAAQISSEVCEVCPNGRFVDRIGVEVGIIPFDHALVVQMSRVRDRLQKGLITGRPADIRRGTAALGTDEAGEIDHRRRYLACLQLH